MIIKNVLHDYLLFLFILNLSVLLLYELNQYYYHKKGSIIILIGTYL